MRLVVFVEPHHGAHYSDILRMAQHAEKLGFDAFFRSDHFVGGRGESLPGPTESWVTLGALAVQTSTIRLGSLASSATFRLPGPLAIAVSQVDQMSAGRIELGLGAGWFAAEHGAYGIPFPDIGERFDRLEEQLAIVTGLWRTEAGKRFNFDGQHYQLRDSPALPKPVQSPHPPILVGGLGPKRTPALAAQYADEYNVPFATLSATGQAFDRGREACRQSDRDVSDWPLTFSAAQRIACGRTEAEARHRAEWIGQTPSMFGTPAQVVDQIGAFEELGANRLFLQILNLADLDHLDVIAEEVAPQIR